MIGIILCGGQSSRMGSDKGLLKLEANTWAQTAVDKLSILDTPVKLSVNRQQLNDYAEVFAADDLVVDAASLQFDFIPVTNSIKLRFVFASEEYPEFAPPESADFNDVFGFFISGPGISGQQNIAKLANGSIVSINNINPVTNSSFYINNGNGNQAPYNTSSNYIQYDGFTKVLEAISPVQCGKKYHLVLSIADVGDGVWDSGIFLQANILLHQY